MKTNKTLAQKLCLLGLESLLSYTAALLAALCFLVLLPGCSLGEKVDREPVQTLECTRPASLSGLYPAGGSVVLISWADYESGRTTVQLVDAEADTVKREVTLDGVWDTKRQALAHGFALCDRETNRWKLLDDVLAETGSFDAENVDGFFSYDGESYYFLRDGVLHCQNVAGGEAQPVTALSQLRFAELTAYDAASGRMAALFRLSPYGSVCGTAVFDPETGAISLLQEQRYQVMLAPAGGMSLLTFDNDKMGYSALCCSGDTFWFADASLFLDAGGALYAVGDAEELIGVGTGRTTLYNVGESITACDLTANGIAGEMYDCCVLPEAGLLVGGMYENGAFRLYVIDPAQLTFEPVASAVPVPSPLTVNETLLQAYWGALNGLPVAESLQEARQQADVLEQRYGVRILLSSQCREAAELSSYPITLSDTMDTEAELNSVRAVLAAMDRSFALYPEGFLAQFRNRAGEGGLCFLLVAHIDSDYGVVGCTYDSADWQYIALDVQVDYKREGTVCHEVWHATENEILSRDYTAFNWDDWNALNPAGFTYWNDSGDYDRYDARWTMFDNGEGVYFVDSYAKLAAQVRNNGIDVTQQGGVTLGQGGSRVNVLLGDDQEVGGRLGIDVIEGEALLVLIHLVGRDLSRDDLTEQTIGHWGTSFVCHIRPLYRISPGFQEIFHCSAPFCCPQSLDPPSFPHRKLPPSRISSLLTLVRSSVSTGSVSSLPGVPLLPNFPAFSPMQNPGGNFVGASRTKKRRCVCTQRLFLLLGFDLAKCVAVIGQTILAHPVRQPERPALGAGHDTGSLQLPVGAAPLIASGLRNFSFGNRHW